MARESLVERSRHLQRQGVWAPMLGEEKAKKDLGLARAMGRQQCPCSAWALTFCWTYLVQQLFSSSPGRQGHRPFKTLLTKSELVFPLLFRNLLCLTLLNPQVWTLGKVFHRHVDWLLTYQEVVPCLFLKELQRFTSIMQNVAVGGEE